ncbi:MAG: hypothetical protein IPI66_11755 [Chitinophagaceae bacterium]|nr:hypothetical protein [Chitinophagaceae bacterium]
MSYLLFIFYLIVLGWMVPRFSFIRRSGLSSRMILGLFVLKVTAGLVIGWFSLHYYHAGNDYWDVNREGWKETQLLFRDPGEYVRNFFRSGYTHGYSGLFDSFQSFWNDLKNNLVIKLLSLFNLLSGGDYYINSLFFNALIFIGHVGLYRLFVDRYPGRQWPVIIGCFLLPSTLYFTSGIQKDGIVFLLLALLIYGVYFYIQQRRSGFWRILAFLTGLAFLFLMRSYVLLLFVPALIAWLLARRLPWRPRISFAGLYLMGIVLFFSLPSFFPPIDPPAIVVQKQADFRGLPGATTSLELDSLRPSFNSFIRVAPRAMNHVLLRPYPAELPSPILLPMNVELVAYQLLFLLFLFFPGKRDSPDRGALTSFLLCFSFSVLLFIGYIAPNLGSLVRYRSLYLPLLITPLLCSVNWKRVGQLIK